MDVLGKIVINSNGLQIDNSTLSKGIYFAKITIENYSQNIKIIKN
ncbi:MAG: hypothetical protein ACJAQ1_001533 [Flavobacterium sp.]|jgi:hypothetical protein